VAVVVASVAVLAVLAVLVVVGHGPLEAPPLGSWSKLSSWYESVGPAVSVMVLLRLAALVLAGWLLLAAALQLLRGVTRLRWLGFFADLISPRSLQRIGHTLAGLSLTAGLAAPAPGAGIPLRVAPIAHMSRVEVAHLPAGDGPSGTATMHLVTDDVPSESPAPASEPAAGEVVVEPGDSLWSLAEDELVAVHGGSSSDREVADYWRRVVEVNRSRLVDPTNADLIYPGQVIVLPPA
jgi:hypothetical protein